MSKKSILFRSKERRERQEVAALLRQLADSLENNDLVLRQGERETRIEAPGTVQVKIKATEKAKRRHTTHALVVKLTWRDGEEGYGHVTVG